MLLPCVGAHPCQQFADVEEVARMLSVERCNHLSGEEVVEGDNLRLHIGDSVFVSHAPSVTF